MKFSKETKYVVENHYEAEAFPLSEAVNVSHFKNGQDLLVVSFVNKEKVNGYLNRESEKSFQVITTKEKFKEFEEHPENAKADFGKASVYFVKKEFLPYFTEFGEWGQLSKINNQKEKNLNDFKVKDVFTQAKSKDYEFIEFVGNPGDRQIWKDSNGKLYMAPFVMSYIQAQLDNGTYHLDELVEHLMSFDNVGFIVEKKWRESEILRCPLTGNEDGVSKIISDIPYYNAENGKDETINLVYYPKSEDIEKIINWKEDKVNYPEIWNVENFIIRVILDCEKFRVNPVADVEPVIPKRKFKS